MLTFPKAVAGVFFAALAFFASGLVVNYLPEGTQLGIYYYVTATVGFIIGWKFLGRRAYDTFTQMLGFGVTTSVLIVFWSLMVFGGYEMYEKSIRMRYNGPVEALVGWVQNGMEYGLLVLNADVMLTLLIGGVIGGWMVHFFAQRTS